MERDDDRHVGYTGGFPDQVCLPTATFGLQASPDVRVPN
jgi:hypothetical protein